MVRGKLSAFVWGSGLVLWTIIWIQNTRVLSAFPVSTRTTVHLRKPIKFARSQSLLYALFSSRKKPSSSDDREQQNTAGLSKVNGGGSVVPNLQRSSPSPPPVFQENASMNPSGIGGQGGVTYNVNALKRNLLQETVRAYKMELLALLQSPSSTEEVICEKLAALVQASAVRTTTDPNLLEASGVRWTLCYQSKYSTVASLKQPYQPLARSNSSDDSRKNTPAMRRVGGKEFSFTRACYRSFHLESVAENEQPYVVDRELYWGGLLRTKRIYVVQSLTRSSLNLKLISNERRVLGRNQKLKAPSMSGIKRNLPIDMTIIYCDTDLCIIADSQQKTYRVYTQADAWKSTQLTRKIRFMLASLWYRLTQRGGGDTTSDSRSSARQLRNNNERIIREVQTHQELIDEESRLIVWQLGAGDDDDEAWESRRDPFVHLSADERQRILKAMSVRQVREAGQDYASHQKRLRLLNFSWLPFRRRTRFQKPKMDKSNQRGKGKSFRGPEP